LCSLLGWQEVWYNEREMKDNGSIVDPEVMKKLLSSVPDGPLKDVEDVLLPEPWPPNQLPGISKHTASKRGPKSQKEWTSEVRRVWGNLHDEEKLAKSWLATLPPIQNLAASTYGSRTTGQGLALQELLKKALAEVQKYDMEDQTREILKSFPNMKMRDIASKLGLDRSHVSRDYTTKAVGLLTKTFQRVIDKLN
jgi:hypothetical protein